MAGFADPMAGMLGPDTSAMQAAAPPPDLQPTMPQQNIQNLPLGGPQAPSFAAGNTNPLGMAQMQQPGQGIFSKLGGALSGTPLGQLGQGIGQIGQGNIGQGVAGIAKSLMANSSGGKKSGSKAMQNALGFAGAGGNLDPAQNLMTSMGPKVADDFQAQNAAMHQIISSLANNLGGQGINSGVLQTAQQQTMPSTTSE